MNSYLPVPENVEYYVSAGAMTSKHFKPFTSPICPR